MSANPEPTGEADLFQQARWVQGLAFAILRDRQLAEDVSQEVLLKALSGEPRQGRVLKAWLAAVTKNLAFNARRDRMRRSAREERAARPETTPPARTSLEVLEAHRALTAAIAALAPDHREVVVMRFFENLDFAAIAERAGVNEAAARMRLHRALEALRTELGARNRDWRSLCALALPAALARDLATKTPLSAAPLLSGSGLKLAAATAGIVLTLAGSWFWWGRAASDSAEEPSIASLEAGLEVNAAPPVLERAALPPGGSAAQIPSMRESTLDLQPFSGRVYFQGQTVSGAEVEIRQGLQRQTVWTDADGMFHAMTDPKATRTILVRTANAATIYQGGGGGPIRIDLVPREQHSVLVRILAAPGTAPVPGAAVRILEGFHPGISYCIGESAAVSVVAEGITDQNGFLMIAQPLPVGFYSFEVQAEGFISYSGLASQYQEGIQEIVLTPGSDPELFVYDSSGAPLLGAQVLFGYPLRRVLAVNADGHVLGILGWNRPLAAEMKDLLIRLPSGRLWLAHEPGLDHPAVHIAGPRVECRIQDPEVTVTLDAESVPEGCWIEAARSHRTMETTLLREGNDQAARIGSADFLGEPWQLLEPGMSTVLERGWAGFGLEVIARLQPQGRELGPFPIVDGHAVVRLEELAHLRLAVTGLPDPGEGAWQVFLRSKDPARRREYDSIKPESLANGVAEIWTPPGLYELTLEHSTLPWKYFWNGERFMPSSSMQWEQSTALQLQAGEAVLNGAVEPAVWRRVRVSLDGHPVHGGQIGPLQLDLEGRVTLPASLDGVVQLPARLRFFPPSALVSTPDAPLWSADFLPQPLAVQLSGAAEASLDFPLAAFRIDPAGLELATSLGLFLQPLTADGMAIRQGSRRLGFQYEDLRVRPDGLGEGKIRVDASNVHWTFRLPAGRYRVWLMDNYGAEEVNLTPSDGIVFAPGTTNTLSKQE